MKTVLLLVHDDPGQEARLQAAIDATRALQGTLTCLDVTDLPDRPFRTFGAPIAAMILDQAAATERHNKAAIHPRVTDRGFAVEWIDVTAALDRALVEAGRLADLVVINTLLPDVEHPDMVALARTLLRELHAPLLAMPATATEFRASGQAIVLWDGSPDAAAAICAAVPLLQRASRVTIVKAKVAGERPTLPIREAARYLYKHDVIAHPAPLDVVGERPVAAIARYLARHEPAFVVMGAFGHGRVYDSLFGSVTGHLLATSSFPLLLASQA